MDDALCTQVDVGDIFYPDQGGNPKAAKKVCRRCLVAQECLEYALAHNERFGVWGGLSERERRSLAKFQGGHWGAVVVK
jgi:WhiB family redox-sensing transcriptional regulator